MREVTTLDEGPSGTFVVRAQTLFAGTTLGAAEVTAKIGEGRIGEVYRARDTTLDGDVADREADRRGRARGVCNPSGAAA